MKFFQIALSITLTTVAFNSHADYNDQRIVSTYYQFEEGSLEHLYGDDVILRKKPSADSDALDTLSIGDELTIVKMMDETMTCYGRESNWYKVKIGRKTGYVLGGFIALDQVKMEDVTYLVIIAGDEDELKVRARVLKSNGEYYGHESRLNTNSIYIEAFDDRGIKGIDNMLCVNLFAEACGVDGGQIYLFNKENTLVEAIRVSSVSDAGQFWFHESLKFPDDEADYRDFVYYERELGHPLDEEMEVTRSVIHTVILRWENGKFSPNVDELDFDEE